MPKRQGFASIPKAKHLEFSSRGGQRKVPKGYAKLDSKQRTENAKRAANIRWDKVRQEKLGSRP